VRALFGEAASAAFFIFGRVCLQARFRRLFRVVLLLILYIVNNPRQISGPETHHTVAILPIKQLAINDLMIDVKGATSFELSNPVAHQQAGRYGGSQVDVILYSTYGLENCIFSLANLVLKVMMDTILDFGREHRIVVLGVPSHMFISL
jgi:hypothetical protein